LNWSAGALPIVGNDVLPRWQRYFSISSSKKIPITVTVSNMANKGSLNLWIIWAKVGFQVTNMTPTNAQQLWNNLNPNPQYAKESNLGTRFPGYKLGVQFYTNAGGFSGVWAYAKECTVVTVTPPGVHTLLTNRWTITQNLMAHEFKDGVPFTNAPDGRSWYFDDWEDDSPHPWRCTQSPDANELLYAIDAPSINNNAWDSTNSYKKYLNYQVYVSWNQTLCSITNNNWHFQTSWISNSSPQFQPNDLNTGLISPLPTGSQY